MNMTPSADVLRGRDLKANRGLAQHLAYAALYGQGCEEKCHCKKDAHAAAPPPAALGLAGSAATRKTLSGRAHRIERLVRGVSEVGNDANFQVPCSSLRLAANLYGLIHVDSSLTLTRGKEMQMFNPPHPGEVLREDLGEVTVTAAARHLGVTRASLSRILNGSVGISPDMALRLSEALGTTPSSGPACSRSTTCGKRPKSGARSCRPWWQRNFPPSESEVYLDCFESHWRA